MRLNGNWETRPSHRVAVLQVPVTEGLQALANETGEALRPRIGILHVVCSGHAPDLGPESLASVAEESFAELEHDRLRVGIAGGTHHPFRSLRIKSVAKQAALHATEQGLLDDPKVRPHVDFVNAQDRQCRDHVRSAVWPPRAGPPSTSPCMEAKRSEVQRALLHLVVDVGVLGAGGAHALFVAAPACGAVDHLPVFKQLGQAIDPPGLVARAFGNTRGSGGGQPGGEELLPCNSGSGASQFSERGRKPRPVTLDAAVSRPKPPQSGRSLQPDALRTVERGACLR